MSYNYGAPPGFGPPGMQAPPGMSAPPGGMGASPPGMPSQHFQAPPGMPDVNFNAPVIRMGGDQQGRHNPPGDRMGGDRGARGSNAEPLGRNRAGLGAGGDHGGRNLDVQRAAVRESMAAMTPPTREEVARTIFIGGIGEGAPDDEKIEDVLRCAGKLRRWARAKDAADKKCKFGFAEYEDVDSLDAANAIFGEGIEVPVFGKGGAVEREEDSGEVKKMKLLVVVDEQSKKYISEWKGKQGEDDDARQFRLEACRDELGANFASMVNQAAFAANALNGEADGDRDVQIRESNGEKADVVNIPLTLEDELADIPENLRATVAVEIRAFRDRSRRRDLENFRQEEEASSAARVNRLASPPPGGPVASVNGIPVGPRDRGGVQGAPSGPKGFRGAQLPNDYVNGVNFVSANGTNGYAYSREDDDAEESDEELERRRQAKRNAELDRQHADAERRWLGRERARAAAVERVKVSEAGEKRELELQKDAIAARLREWDDEEEARLGKEEYYRDHSAWLRKRAAFRDQEQRDDEHDRDLEAREKAEERRREAEAKGMADDFLNQMDIEVSNRAAQQGRPQQQQTSGFGGFKMSLGSAAQRAAKPQSAAPRRAMAAEFENLLEDEEDAAASGLKRPELKPLTDTSTAPLNSTDMTDDERAAEMRGLAASIPTDTAELFSYPVKFNYLTPTILEEQVKPFVEKKVVESLGVQEDLLVDAVVDALKERKEAKEVVGELEDALEEEAEGLVRRVWRMVVFLTECEGRGLS